MAEERTNRCLAATLSDRISTWCGATVLLAAVVAALFGCQTEQRPALSLEQAKSVAASFAGRAFTPPPRRIEDIHDLLDAASDTNRAELVALRARADARAPTGSTPEERAGSAPSYPRTTRLTVSIRVISFLAKPRPPNATV